MARVEIHIVGTAAKLCEAVDQGIAGLNRMADVAKRHEATLRNVWMKSGIALAGQILLIRNLTQVYEKQEQADMALAHAMKTRGIYTEGAYQQTKAFAAEMQKLTVYGDEEIQQAQALLIAVGKLSGEGLERATKATLDLAAAKGMDLVSAADLVSKSIGSTMNALSRYGVVIEEGLIDPTERAEAITRGISSLFEDRAAAAARTYTGQLEQTGNLMGDLKETLAEALMPMIARFNDLLKEHLPAIIRWVQEHKTMIAVILGGGTIGTGLVLALAQLALAFTNPVTGFIAILAIAVISVTTLVAWIKKLKGESGESEGLAEKPTTLEGFNRAIDETRAKIEEFEHRKQVFEERMATARTEKEKAPVFKIGGLEIGKVDVPPREMIGLDTAIKSTEEGIQKWEAQLAELEQGRDRLQQVMDDIRSQLSAPVAPEALPEEIEQPEIAFPGALTEDALTEQEALREQHLENMRQHYIELEETDENHRMTLREMWAEHNERMDEQWQSHIERSKARAAELGWGLYHTFDSAFGSIFQLHVRFTDALLFATVRGLVGMLHAVIDAGVQELVADEIKAIAKLMIRGVFDWSAFAKIAAVTAAAGAGKSALQGLASGLEGKLGGGRYKYGGVLPHTGLFFGEKGEHVFNPEEPLESAANVGGGMALHWHQYGAVRGKDEVEDALREFGDNIVYGNLGRRLATP